MSLVENAGNPSTVDPPDELISLPWCCWEWYWDGEREKWRKPPTNLYTGEWIESRDPKDLFTYHEVQDHENKGFLLTEDDDLVLIDLDGCIQGDQINPVAQNIIDELDSYTELSPSGDGLHIYAKGYKLPNHKSRFYIGDQKVEVYDRNQYSTFTGKAIRNSPIRDAQHWIDREVPVEDNGVAAPAPPSILDLSDREITTILSRSIDEFDLLYYQGDVSEHPSPSEADLALCGMICFVTTDPHTIDRIYRSSGLYRPKWEKPAYRNSVINKAISNNRKIYVGSKRDQFVQRLNVLSLEFIKWGSMVDCYVYRSLLTIGNRYGYLSDESLLLYSSLRDLSLIANISDDRKSISRALRNLENMGLISILEIGDVTGTLILLRSPVHVSSLGSEVTNSRIVSISNPTIINQYSSISSTLFTPSVLIMYGGKSGQRGFAKSENQAYLSYIRGINRTQLFALELISLRDRSLEELGEILGMRKDHLKSRVITPLRKFVKVRGGKYTLRKNVMNIVHKEIDYPRLHKMRDTIQKERKVWMRKNVNRAVGEMKTENSNETLSNPETMPLNKYEW